MPFSTSVYMFAAFRFFDGFFASSFYRTTFIMGNSKMDQIRFFNFLNTIAYMYILGTDRLLVIKFCSLL